MKHPFLFIHLALSLIASSAPALAADDTPKASASGAITEIVVERSACYGSCPVDTLVLRANGKAEYTGKANTRLTGEFAGVFSRDDFDRLAHWLVTEGFFQLEERDRAVSITDVSEETIRVTRDGKSKSVARYFSQSLQLWAMGNLIRSVAADIQWQPAHSGIRGQVLRKQPGEEWRALPEENIWVTPAGTRDGLSFRPDQEGRFEINLAPGTYSVSWQHGMPQTVVVEPDRFTEADLRFDVASRNATSQYRDPPPPPGDGLYLADSSATKWMFRKGNEEYRLGDAADLAILDKQLASEGPDNATFWLALTVPYDEKRRSLDLFSLLLVVGDTAYKPISTSSKGKESPSVFFHIPGEEHARQVAGFFDIPVSHFSRPDYKLSVSLTPTKQSFKRGEAVTATLRIVNNGTGTVQFTNPNFGSGRDDYIFTARRNGQPLTDISFAGDRGGTANLQYLRPGTTFEDMVSLDKWFEFKEAGSYAIHGSYRLNIREPREVRVRMGLMSWTEDAAADFVVTIE